MTIWQKIGTAFSNGWKNGNLLKGVAATGSAAFTVGLTGAMIHDLNKNNNGCNCSIFSGMGCGYGNMLGFPGLYNSYNNPMAFGMMGTNPYLTQQGQMAAFQYGAHLAQQAQQSLAMNPNMTLNPEQYEEEYKKFLNKYGPERSNEDAGDISEGTTDDKGKAFDTGTDELGDKDSDTKEVTIAENIKTDTDYKTQIKALAESYIKSMDSDGDGHVSEEEYIEHEMKKFEEKYPNATEAQKDAYKRTIKVAYVQMNLNRDDAGIDWKEMSSTIATYDVGGKSKGTLDGKITRSEYTKANSALTDGSFGKSNWANYKNLFGDPDKE